METEEDPRRPVLPAPDLNKNPRIPGFMVALRLPLWEGVGMHEVIGSLHAALDSLMGTMGKEENMGLYDGEVRPVLQHNDDYSAVMPVLLTAEYMEEEFTEMFNEGFSLIHQMRMHLQEIPDGMPIVEQDSPTSELGTATAEPETDGQPSRNKEQE